mmetsp:Transcript_55284/g.103683  ORF Transcript_55284/g.103683 Transcript_55284/m.103683 type:complete len:215 (+) Transcript_55284:85-729(+)
MRSLAWCVIAWTLVSAGGQINGAEESPARSVFAAAAQGGFGVASESHSGEVAPYGDNNFVSVASLPTQLPMTELEAEVQRTSRVAAFLAQDAAVLSKELQGLQISLRGHARLEPDLAAEEAPPFSAVSLSADEERAGPDNKTAVVTDKTASKDSEGPACDGPGQTPCSPVNRILTFDYRYPMAWGLLNWALVIILAFLTAWCCCACCFRPRSAR